MGVYIKGMEMPKKGSWVTLRVFPDGQCFLYSWCGNDIDFMEHLTAVPVPPHGRLIDADALVEDLQRQCEEVFKIDAVSPDDFWITRDHAYNERLWKTWCESFYKYLESRPTVIRASEEAE